MLEFVGEIKGMTLGLVKVNPKDADGNPIEDNKTTWIDFDETQKGIQEGKEWVAVVKYLQTFEDKNDNNIPDFPDMYRVPVKRFFDVGKK